jgi:hypothetical protein
MANLARARPMVRAARTFMSPKAAGPPSNLSLQLTSIDTLNRRMSISRSDRREEITLISAAAAFLAAFAVALAVIAAVLAVVVG